MNTQMSTLEIDLPVTDWIETFDPNKRLLTGPYYLIAKRIMDLGIGLLTMPAWLPLMILIAIGVMVTSSGPVFFIQYRTGKGGKRFRMFKFRSMVKDADKMAHEVANVDANGSLTGPLKMKNDPRITPFGRILRKTSLDELPQVLNVLLGNMSLVGPRPTSWSPESYKLWHTERLDVLPGITGLWQISDRGDEDFDEWLRWDIRYIERRSLWFDIVIMVRTFTSFLKHSGAR